MNSNFWDGFEKKAYELDTKWDKSHYDKDGMGHEYSHGVTVKASPKDMQELFGSGHNYADNYKSILSYGFKNPSNPKETHSIYDWKETSSYWPEKGVITPRQFKNSGEPVQFNIGSRTKEDSLNFKKWVESKLHDKYKKEHKIKSFLGLNPYKES